MEEERLQDYRFFRIYQIISAFGGKSTVLPGSVFPSLKDLDKAPSEDVDPEEAYEKVIEMFSSAGRVIMKKSSK